MTAGIDEARCPCTCTVVGPCPGRALHGSFMLCQYPFGHNCGHLSWARGSLWRTLRENLIAISSLDLHILRKFSLLSVPVWEPDVGEKRDTLPMSCSVKGQIRSRSRDPETCQARALGWVVNLLSQITSPTVNPLRPQLLLHFFSVSRWLMTGTVPVNDGRFE